jgi:hypothetical protein
MDDCRRFLTQCHILKINLAIRVITGHPEVVLDDHDIANFKIFVEATSGIGDDEKLHSKQTHDLLKKSVKTVEIKHESGLKWH